MQNKYQKWLNIIKRDKSLDDFMGLTTNNKLL